MRGAIGPRVTAVIPVKDLHNAKQRLSPVLGPTERKHFFEAMVRDVIDAVSGALLVEDVFLITCDPEAKALAAAQGLGVVEEPSNRGHTAAVKFAADTLKGWGVDTMLTIPGDIPLVNGAEIDAVVHAHLPGPGVTISPAHDEMGSNAIVCTPPDALDFRFGDNSFFPHLHSARKSGMEPRVVSCTGISLDIDLPCDLEIFIREPSATRAYQYLEHIGIAKGSFSAG